MTAAGLEFFEPSRVPPELARYAGRTRQLAVGSPGKLGGLRLELFRDSSGRTSVRRVWRKVPLQVLTPFYYDEAHPEIAIIYILNPTGGILQGDRLRLDVSLGPSARALLTTQAATKVYRMNSDFATQTANFVLGRDSYLEYLPDQTIPFRGSRFYQETNVRMGPGASFVSWEIVTAGRAGRERFDFDVFYAKLSVTDRSGKPRLTDTVMIEPKRSDPSALGVMSGFEVVGNFYLVTDRTNEGLVDRLESILRGEQVAGGVSPLSVSGGLMARVVGSSSRVVRTALEKVWNEVRLEMLGSPAPRIRK